jgi:hypothetical protein
MVNMNTFAAKLATLRLRGDVSPACSRRLGVNFDRCWMLTVPLQGPASRPARRQGLKMVGPARGTSIRGGE